MVTEELTIVADFKFSPEFSVLSSEGQEIDESDLSIMLNTVVRMVDECSGALPVESFSGLCVWGKGKGIYLSKTAEGYDLFYKSGVTGWAEISEYPLGAEPLMPLLPSLAESAEALKLSSEVEWFGVLDEASSTWLHQGHADADSAVYDALALVIRKMGVLLKRQPYAGKRIAFFLGGKVLWTWENTEEQLLMVLAAGEDGNALALHCGEAFLFA